MEAQDGAAFEFGAFRFEPAERVLYRGSERVPLSPKAADTLFVLLKRHGRVVEKNELIQLVWPDTFVEEGGLARNISALRKALGDDAEGSRYIETVPKRGYRFVAPLRSAAGESEPAVADAPRQRAKSRLTVPALAVGALALLAGAGYISTYLRRNSAPPSVRSVAVIPLKNISGDAAQDYFAEGMRTEIATELSKGLTVIAWPSAGALRPDAALDDIGKRLHVDAVIRGSVLAADQRVRINAELIETRTGRVLWSDSYQREFKDILRLQAEVASAVAGRVKAAQASGKRAGTPISTPREVVPEAYQAYLRGRFFWNKRTEVGLRKAVEYFDEAIAKDPTYAPAYAGRADSLALLGSNSYDAIPPREAMPEAKRAAQKALELDPELAEAHTSLAYITMVYDGNLDAAEQEFQKALVCNPGYATARHWRAHCLLAAGKVDEASAEMRRAQNLDPTSLPVNVGVGWCLYFARRYDEAIRQYRMTLEMEQNFALAHQTLGMALLQQHKHQEAITEFQTALTLSGGDTASASPSAIAFLGYAHGLAGSKAEALKELARLAELSGRRYVPAIYPAMVYLGLGDRGNFSRWLSKAREEKSEYLIYYQRDPAFGSALAGK